MRAFFKTLFGDWLNLGFVALVVALTAALAQAGFTVVASVLVPVVILAGVAWLATR